VPHRLCIPILCYCSANDLWTDDHRRVDVCGHNSRRQRQRRPPADESIGYISSVNYPSLYPPDTDCHCLLTTSRSDAQLVFYVLDIKLAAPSGEPMCDYDWVAFGDEHARGANTKLCDWSPHVPVYTASDHVTLTFHSDSAMEARGFWIQYVGKVKSETVTPP